MKWVKIHEGTFKYVEDSDERPSVKLPHKKIGIPFTPFNPSWKQYESGMHSDDPKVALDSSEKFESERNHAIQTDRKAASWEKSRKEGWQKDKPYYVKKVQEAGI